ncbi:MAG: cytochrome P460 family protein [Salinibacterium sp.]|nr:cytochrome P460 family protein [Planctomycetota bacterium]MCB1280878.1 cytochrome P460 family protein [Salinibacterium sp.]
MRIVSLFTLATALLVGCLTPELKVTGDTADLPAAARSDAPAVFDEDGRLLRPKGYREWIFVGAPLTPDDMNDGAAAFPEFHSVYIDRASYEHWKANGTWRDGTVFVKELVSVGTKVATSGNGYFMGRFSGVEVAVKDRKRFADQPGGWSYFRFTDENGGPPHATAKALPVSACASCHKASADDDLVFTQYYPVLTAAKRFGIGRPEDR